MHCTYLQICMKLFRRRLQACWWMRRPCIDCDDNAEKKIIKYCELIFDTRSIQVCISFNSIFCSDCNMKMQPHTPHNRNVSPLVDSLHPFAGFIWMNERAPQLCTLNFLLFLIGRSVYMMNGGRWHGIYNVKHISIYWIVFIGFYRRPISTTNFISFGDIFLLLLFSFLVWLLGLRLCRSSKVLLLY